MMRYHKAVAISKLEADFIIANVRTSASDIVVLAHNDDWYDVRGMTRDELLAFSDDLQRKEFATEQARKYPFN